MSVSTHLDAKGVLASLEGDVIYIDSADVVVDALAGEGEAGEGQGRRSQGRRERPRPTLYSARDPTEVPCVPSQYRFCAVASVLMTRGCGPQRVSRDETESRRMRALSLVAL